MTYVWRNLLQRKVRTGLSMLGVSVSVAGIVALISVAVGLRSSLDQYMVSTGASLTVLSRDVLDPVFSVVKNDEVAAIRAMPGVEDVSRAHFTMRRMPESKSGRKALLSALFCFGRYPEERAMEKYARYLTAGRLFEKRRELIASRTIARQLGWEVGSKTKLFGERGGEYEVVGIFQSDISWENAGVIMHGDILGPQLGREDNCTMALVYAADGTEEAVQARIEAAFPDLTAVPAAEFTSTLDSQLAMIDEFILIVTVIALVVGILGVLNTMMMSVSERTREIGMLRALGWSRRRVIRLILIEGTLLSAVGGAFGLLLGVAGTETLVRVYADAFLVAEYRPDTFVKGAAVALVVGIVAALLPALRAANLKPVEALRHE